MNDCEHPEQLQRRFGIPHHNDDPERWFVLVECRLCGAVRQIEIPDTDAGLAMYQLGQQIERPVAWLSRQRWVIWFAERRVVVWYSRQIDRLLRRTP